MLFRKGLKKKAEGQSFRLSDIGWQQAEFDDFSWKREVLRPERYIEADGVFISRDGNMFRKTETAALSGNKLQLSMGHGRGKVSDAGYDQFVCYYTEIPAGRDVIVSADISVQKIPDSDFLTFQEGFGIFLRDTMAPDQKTGYPYSNMAAAGGYYGRCNFFGRHGITADSLERTDSFARYGIQEDQGPFVGIARHGTYHVTLALEGAGIWADIEDESENHLLSGKDRWQGDLSRKAGFFMQKEHQCWLRIPERTMFERESDRLYLGFFSANGYNISIDTRSVKVFWKERGERRPQASVIYTSPKGDCTGTGSEEAPYDLPSALLQCRDGMEIRMLPGRYLLQEDVLVSDSMSGSRTFRRKLTGIQKAGNGPVIDFAGTRHALVLEGSYWDIEGICITGGHGIKIQGSHNTVRSCRTYRNLETGILIRHADINAPKEAWPADNYITGCISYCNEDLSGRNADGFACKIASGAGNIFEDCVSFLNTDDGFDLFCKNRVIGAVSLKNCRSFLNGYRQRENGRLTGTPGNGNGFKLGGSGISVKHTAEGCTAMGNKGTGFTSNSNPQLHLASCIAKNNGKENIQYCYSGVDNIPAVITENCITGEDSGFNAIKMASDLLEGLKEG